MTASLLVSSGLLIWFTKMAIKLRSQLVNSMSEIANSVVDKFVTSTVSSSSASSMIENSSSSETLSEAAGSVKGLAADIGLSGGDGGNDGDGGGASDGSGSDGHNLWNTYGGDGDPGGPGEAGETGNSVPPEDGRSGFMERRNRDAHGFAATGSGTSRVESMSEDAAKLLGEQAMDSSSLASLSGEDDGLDLRTASPNGDVKSEAQAESSGKDGKLDARAASSGKDGKLDAKAASSGADGKVRTVGAVPVAATVSATSDAFAAGQASKDGQGAAAIGSEAGSGGEGGDADAAATGDLAGPDRTARVDATGLLSDHDRAGRQAIGKDGQGNLVYSDGARADSSAYVPEQKKEDAVKNDAFATSTTGDVNMRADPWKSKWDTALPPDVQNRDAIMPASSPNGAGRAGADLSASYDRSVRTAEVGEQYAKAGMSGGLSPASSTAAKDAYRDVKAAGGSDADARRAAVAEGARTEAVDRGYDLPAADRIAAAAVAYDTARADGRGEGDARQTAAGAAAAVQAAQDGGDPHRVEQAAAGGVAYASAVQDGAGRDRAVQAGEAASAYVRAEQAGSPPEKAREAAAGAATYTEAVRSGGTEAQAVQARDGASAYARAVQAGVSPEKAEQAAAGAAAYTETIRSGGTEVQAVQARDGASAFTKVVQAGASTGKAAQAAAGAAAYTGAIQSGGTREQAILASKGASAYVQAQQAGAPPEKAQQAAASMMAYTAAVQSGKGGPEANGAGAAASAYTEAVQKGAAPAEAVARANGASAYAEQAASGATEQQARLAGTAASMYTKELAGGATHEHAARNVYEGMTANGVSAADAKVATDAAAAHVQAVQGSEGAMGGTASVDAQARVLDGYAEPAMSMREGGGTAASVAVESASAVSRVNMQAPEVSASVQSNATAAVDAARVSISGGYPAGQDPQGRAQAFGGAQAGQAGAQGADGREAVQKAAAPSPAAFLVGGAGQQAGGGRAGYRPEPGRGAAGTVPAGGSGLNSVRINPAFLSGMGAGAVVTPGRPGEPAHRKDDQARKKDERKKDRDKAEATRKSGAEPGTSPDVAVASGRTAGASAYMKRTDGGGDGELSRRNFPGAENHGEEGGGTYRNTTA